MVTKRVTYLPQRVIVKPETKQRKLATCLASIRRWQGLLLFFVVVIVNIREKPCSQEDVTELVGSPQGASTSLKAYILVPPMAPERVWPCLPLVSVDAISSGVTPLLPHSTPPFPRAPLGSVCFSHQRCPACCLLWGRGDVSVPLQVMIRELRQAPGLRTGGWAGIVGEALSLEGYQSGLCPLCCLAAES